MSLNEPVLILWTSGGGAWCYKMTTLRHVEITSMYGNTSTQCCKDSAKPYTGSFAIFVIRETLYHICILYKHDSREMCGYEQNVMNIIRKAGGCGLANDIHHLDKNSSQDTFKDRQQHRLGHFKLLDFVLVLHSFVCLFSNCENFLYYEKTKL